MKLLKLNNLYINTDHIVSINTETDYIHLSDGDPLKLDHETIMKLITPGELTPGGNNGNGRMNYGQSKKQK